MSRIKLLKKINLDGFFDWHTFKNLTVIPLDSQNLGWAQFSSEADGIDILLKLLCEAI